MGTYFEQMSEYKLKTYPHTHISHPTPLTPHSPSHPSHPTHTPHTLTLHTGPNSLLLIATQEAIHYLPVLPDSPHLTSSRPQPLPIGPLYNVSAVAYDPVNERVLWVDKETQFLHRCSLECVHPPLSILHSPLILTTHMRMGNGISEASVHVLFATRTH